MKIGDVVSLKSVGPPMTISDMKHIGGGTDVRREAYCIWFDENYVLHQAWISLEALEPFECECDHSKSNKEEVDNLQN